MKNSQGTLVAIGLGVAIIAILVIVFRNPSLPPSDNNPTLDQIRANFIKLDPDYGKIPLKEANSAYTENKSVIYLCLKDPVTGGEYDMNTMMYVSIHELAHTVSKTHGHNEEFKRNFASLLRKGAQIGIYDPSKPIPTNYCGVHHD